MHLAIKPGTNLALLNGLAQHLIEHGWVDRAFVDEHTVGIDGWFVTRIKTGAPQALVVA